MYCNYWIIKIFHQTDSLKGTTKILILPSRFEMYVVIIISTVCLLSLYLEFGGFGSVSGKIDIEIKINHEGEVNRSVIVIYPPYVFWNTFYWDTQMSVLVCKYMQNVLLHSLFQSKVYATKSMYYSNKNPIVWRVGVWLH